MMTNFSTNLYNKRAKRVDFRGIRGDANRQRRLACPPVFGFGLFLKGLKRMDYLSLCLGQMIP